MGQTRASIHVVLLSAGLFSLFGVTGILGAQSGGGGPTVESKLTAADTAPGNFFGATVAVRGRTAVVGANQMTVGAGAAYVLNYNGSSWAQTARLAASDGVTGDQFGSAVAIGDNTIVVGAEGDADVGAATGSAYVFELQGTQWIRTQKLIAADQQAGAHFGVSATIDGNTLLIGAWGRNSVAGAAYVFERSNGTWQQTAVLVPNDAAANDFFGLFVTLQGDTVLVGSPGDDDLGSNSGSGYVFTRSNGTWSQTAKLLASDGVASDFLGRVGSLSGNTLVMGARDNDDRGSSSGSAYVFQLQNGIWTQTARLLASDGRANDVFGQSVGISGDRIVVGAKWRDDNLRNNSGAAYVFERSNATGVWGQTAKLNASDPLVGDEYGHSIAIDGPTILVGAHRKSLDRGAAYAYHPPNLVDPDQSLIRGDDPLISAFGGETRIVVTPRKSDGTNLGAGLVVELSTVGGSLVGAVADNGDGTYTQTLQGAPGTSTAVVSAVVEGLQLSSTAAITLLPVSLSASTVTVNPEEINPGQSATVTVTPKTDTGTNTGPGLTVTIETTLGTLAGQVVDNGDGTYAQQLDTTTHGTASISAVVNGLPLSNTATLAVVPETSEHRIIGIGKNGTPIPFKSIQDAINHSTDSMKIVLAPGHFDEIVRIKKRCNLTIQALPTLGLTTVRGFWIKHSQHITIDGIHVDATNSKCGGIVVDQSSDIVLRNGLVQGTSRYRPGIKIGLGSGDVRVENFGVDSCGGDGIRVKRHHYYRKHHKHHKHDHGHGQLTIWRCVVRDNQRSGIHIAKDVHVRIEGCEILNNGLKGWSRDGYGVLRQRQFMRKCYRKWKRHSKHKDLQVMPEMVTLIGNTVAGNHGRVVQGQSDQNFGNHDQMIDSTDDQALVNN
ncbi:MAG: invasin domain 3-containing protein [Planctomycetota bacterium]|jgi:hypothetical protein